ncbi:hypothetical protein OIV83_005942 [Microbotryomycetes sp. JL201]|nr:hypothetical protein OIV83_005942 [Microbotryomycetes sp. JL201]
MSLNNRVSVITGAGRGIGLAAAKVFLREGGKVFLSDINLDEARAELANESQDRIGWINCDVTKEDQVDAMFQAALKQFGQIDTAIINAGILSPIKPWLETPPQDASVMLDVNVMGAWLTAKHAVKAMSASPHKGQGGSLVFVASVASLYGEPGLSAYSASKWAVRGLSLCAANEFAPLGIRSNCVQPGATDTKMFDAFGPELKAAVTDTIPLKRMAKPEEIAEVMAFLASDKSSYMNGSTVAVHGGQKPT